MQPRAILLLTAAALALTPTAAGAALYKGKTSEGRSIAIRASHGWLERAATNVMCDGYPSSAVFDDGGAIRHGRFRVDQDTLLSGTGGEDDSVHFEGRVRGDKITGRVEYFYEAAPADPDAGAPSSCAGRARFTVKRVAS